MIRRVARKVFKLSEWGLEGLAMGKPVTLYHGTTRNFKKFNLTKSREDLVNNYYGVGIFFTPDKRVAGMYADANRNIGFDPSIIREMKRINPQAGDFLHLLYKRGDEAWNLWGDIVDFEDNVGVDPNTLSDVAGYIIESKVVPLNTGSGNIFNQTTGAPDWVYDSLDELGLDSSKYRPKIYTVKVRCHNPLVTSSRAKAKKARLSGYDSVVYYGPGLIRGVPEVAIYNPANVRIQKVEVI